MDPLNVPRRRRESTEINLTPILDMLVSIIFFLLIFCVFSGYSQLSLPAVEEVAGVDSKAPLLAPKILVRLQKNNQVVFDLSWRGNTPGRQSQSFSMAELSSRNGWLVAMQKFTEGFAIQYPQQKSIEVGMEGQFSYQHLLFVIDALAPKFPDVALVDPKKVSQERGRK